MGRADSGYQVLRYEAALYRHKEQGTEVTLAQLRSTAVYGAEHHPEYFGPFPAPVDTPRGRTLRSKALWNGVWRLETDRGERMLALCYPVWNGDITFDVQVYAEQTPQDRAQGIDTTYGCLFFPWEAACLPLFELLCGKPLEGDAIHIPALKNMILDRYPDYAQIHNQEVQARQGRGRGGLWMEEITHSPEAGTVFLEF